MENENVYRFLREPSVREEEPSLTSDQYSEAITITEKHDRLERVEKEQKGFVEYPT
jgi:hypothetical protein